MKKFSPNSISRRRARRNSGVSVILVAILGAVALAMAMAAMDPLLVIFRYLSNQDYQQRVNCAAEDAAQYTIAYIKDKAAKGGLDSTEETILLPPELTTQVEVSAVLSAPLALAQLDDTAAFTYRDKNEQWEGLPASNRPIVDVRRLSVVAKSGTSQYSITLILKGNQYELDETPGNNNLFFNNAILSSKATISGQVKIEGGDLVAIPAEKNLVSIEGSPDATIDGNVHYAPDSKMISTLGGADPPFIPEDQPNGNVLGGDGPGGTVGDVDTNINTAKSMMPSAPSAPDSGVVDLGSVNLVGTNDNPVTMTLTPGDYTASSFSLGANSKLILDTGSSPDGVRIFLQGSNSGDSAMSLSNQSAIVFSNSSTANASNLQIFYNGSKSISINNTMTGFLYAPNATINVNTSNGNFNGALVGNTVSVSGNNSIVFNSQSATPGNGGPGVAPGPAYLPYSKSHSYSVVSWNESKTSP